MSPLACTGFFFFSSRRRHTISDRDWSSDVCSSDLELDPVCPGAFLARLDLEADPLAPRQRIEVDARVKPGTVKEILLSVLSRDEAESTVGDQLLDGPCRHRQLLLSKAMSRTPASFREDPTAANIARLPGTGLHYHRLAAS